MEDLLGAALCPRFSHRRLVSYACPPPFHSFSSYSSLHRAGENYIRLNGTQDLSPGAPGVYHSTFSPKLHNATGDRAALKAMASLGYNVVGPSLQWL